MKKVFILLFVFLPSILRSQVKLGHQGINFKEYQSWEEVQEKAKKESKYIFVDCYATWCEPCKRMDRFVFTDSSIGKFCNQKFISIKVQMDKTDFDSKEIMTWYAIAKDLELKYTITSYPTFLFFTPDGELIHKATGFLSSTNFYSVLKDVFTPEKQYYSILKQFRPGIMDTSQMKKLARAFRHSDTNLSDKIARDYLMRIPYTELTDLDNISLMAEFQRDSMVKSIGLRYLLNLSKHDILDKKNIQLIIWYKKHEKVVNLVRNLLGVIPQNELSNNSIVTLVSSFKSDSIVSQIVNKYLVKLNRKERFKKNNIKLIGYVTNNSKDRWFNFIFLNNKKINKIMKDASFSENIIDNIITKEEIDTLLVTSNKLNDLRPNWGSIFKRIKKKYSTEYADRNVLFAQVNWYHKINEWDNLTKYAISLIEKYKSDTTNWLNDLDRNNIAWTNIFLHSYDKNQIDIGIKWMEGVVRRDSSKTPTFIDTYANLLYKAGRIQEAIDLEEEACRLNPEDKSFRNNLMNMKKGVPTWTVGN